MFIINTLGYNNYKIIYLCRIASFKAFFLIISYNNYFVLPIGIFGNEVYYKES